MSRIVYRRIRRRTSSPEGGAAKRESKQEQFFSGHTSHESFFQPTASIQRKCDKCEEKDKEVQRQPDKKEEEKKVMRAADMKEEEKVMRTEDKKEEKDKLHRQPEKKEEEKKLQRLPEKKEEEKLQKKELGTAASSTGNVSNYVSSLDGKGTALPPQANQFFSARMGHDFSQVKIHHDKQAAESAKEVNAKAYAVGHHIVFNEGQYNTQSGEGKKLLAHELAHVVQNQESTLSRKTCAPGAHPEKSSQQVSQYYRRQGDHRKANAIDLCCEDGQEFCLMVVLDREVDKVYQQVIQSQIPQTKPNQVSSASSPSVLQAGMVAGAFAPALPWFGGGAAVPTAAAPVTATGTGITAGAIGTTAAIALPLIMIGATIWQAYDRKKKIDFLESLGYTVIADALGVCIGACHASTLNEPRPNWDKWGDLDMPGRWNGPTLDRIPTDMRFWPQKQTPGPQTTFDPFPFPQLPEPDQDRRRNPCRPGELYNPMAPTGLTKNDPIEIVWYKPLSKYEDPISIQGKDYNMRTPGQRLPTPYEDTSIGVQSQYLPYVGKSMLLFHTYDRNAQARFRTRLLRAGYSWRDKNNRPTSPDHVTDLMWNGPDEFENLWPLESTYNERAGMIQNMEQYVYFRPDRTRPCAVFMPIGEARYIYNMGQRFFRIRSIQSF